MSLRLDVIKWEDTSRGTRMVQRVPAQGMADMSLGSRCIVQEGQAAVFFRNGQAMDTLKPGGHTLSTENIPLISNLYKLVYKDAPFQSSVYFVSLKPFRDLKWGTKEPILLEDTKFGFVNVRAFGKLVAMPGLEELMQWIAANGIAKVPPRLADAPRAAPRASHANAR